MCSALVMPHMLLFCSRARVSFYTDLSDIYTRQKVRILMYNNIFSMKVYTYFINPRFWCSEEGSLEKRNYIVQRGRVKALEQEERLGRLIWKRGVKSWGDFYWKKILRNFFFLIFGISFSIITCHIDVLLY